ncbi:MAG TPA: Gfo/Idh/MocA family oxidoreductase, partial [Chloroflexota bacterium]|nr:Gfo/Idh/MocA family oxidoreductase [Chloroflexota bacterium]
LWDLAPHDIALLLDLLDAEPLVISARGAAYVRPGIHDVAYIELRFPHKVMAHVHVSWLDPSKVRRLTVIGSKRMAVLDDTAADKLQVFDRGVEAVADADGTPNLLYRYGEGTSIPLPDDEPLRRQCAAFLDAIRGRTDARPYARQALAVVRILEHADRSLRNGGYRQWLAWDATERVRPANRPPAARLYHGPGTWLAGSRPARTTEKAS